jgi:hypothetical protein
MMRTRSFSPLQIAQVAWLLLMVLIAVTAFCRVRVGMTEVRRASGLRFLGLQGYSREAIDFQWLLRAPGAEDRFMQLVERGTPAARIYGVCGLQLIASRHLEAARARLLEDDAELASSVGCLIQYRSVRELAADMPRMCPNFRMDVGSWAVAEAARLIDR